MGRLPRTRSALVLLLLVIAGCTTLKRCAYEGIGRDAWQHPAEVIEALALRPGDHVADLGSGTGYFTFRLARAVGPRGKVYAVDVDEALNAELRAQAAREGHGNIDVIDARPDDPGLPAGAIDLIFTSNTYHHLKNRAAYFARLKTSLKPGGRLAIIEFDGRGWMPLFSHSTPPETITSEMRTAGYTLQKQHDFLPRQSFLVFTPDG
jgi:predicted methyltransferase